MESKTSDDFNAIDPNLIIGDPKKSPWKLQDMKLSLGWSASKGTIRWETCTIADDGSWFVGRDAHGDVIRGQRSE